ncbi:putative mitochondrial substrate carrier protein [Botrytis fragariae]|uniref:Putative mitochondrial substrate carrier protein n=1 Tax=Botrytis fragariae TaxID=1964551 RepID=A0A8H6B075_9HELO|nr:putative mitochondrial substrate carrier protein [Botrytis fragariae]KAF5876740.1 putative mitochondrial substrate carrier protein [Botrytis fragariae]
MAEYTSTIQGFQRAMEESLIGPPAEAKTYAEATALPTFYHVMNGQKSNAENWIKGIEMWRGKISAYQPVVDQFLRDGDSLAAHMTGTIKVDGEDTEFESFMFGKVDKQSGKLEWLQERSIWGPQGGAPEHGAN